MEMQSFRVAGNLSSLLVSADSRAIQVCAHRFCVSSGQVLTRKYFLCGFRVSTLTDLVRNGKNGRKHSMRSVRRWRAETEEEKVLLETERGKEIQRQLSQLFQKREFVRLFAPLLVMVEIADAKRGPRVTNLVLAALKSEDEDAREMIESMALKGVTTADWFKRNQDIFRIFFLVIVAGICRGWWTGGDNPAP
eukprot:TRINITY_DN5843_c0_g1_i2.p1 TRINITY_DN5843_c0_g1~~TRINITY_DN5843_c0_g1_i2.p1  ORF type:complete len:193 (+),score=15.67 TRINITY_DN5843_c0_g1_i2:48-626(+)